MKKKITLTLAFMAFFFSYGQYNVPLTNADFESSTPMTTTDDVKYTIDGMYINEAVDGAFDETSSGLAPDEGVGGSQAFKIVTQDSGSTLSWHTQFYTDRVDISGYGMGDFTFSFKMKAANVPAGYPIWMIINTYDEDGAKISGETLYNYTNGGAAQYWLMADDYQEASIPFSIQANSGGGKNAKFVELAVQMSKYTNTYWIDDLSLASSMSLSLEEFKNIGLSMYPNPATNFTTIKSVTTINNISVYSVTGKLIFNKTIDKREYNLDVSSFSKGMYLLSVSNDKGKSTTKLIVD